MHDPLTAWKMSASKKASAQRRGLGPSVQTSAGPGSGLEDEGTGISVDASFVRSRVREKLEGWDRGELLSVEGQVKCTRVSHATPCFQHVSWGPTLLTLQGLLLR